MRFVLGSMNTEVLIDEPDYVRIRTFHMWVDYRGHGKLAYVRMQIGPRKVYLHRYIMDADAAYEVDHINHNGLDNRRENLRLVMRSANMHNGSDPHRGVWQNPSDGKWEAYIMKDYTKYHLGRYPTFDEALAARTAAWEALQRGVLPEARDQQSANKARAAAARGVSFDKTYSKWRAYVRRDGQRVSLGYYTTEEAALAAVAGSRP